MCCCAKHWHDGKFCLFLQNVEKKGRVRVSVSSVFKNL
jgi:hypothetical protein